MSTPVASVAGAARAPGSDGTIACCGAGVALPTHTAEIVAGAAPVRSSR